MVYSKQYQSAGTVEAKGEINVFCKHCGAKVSELDMVCDRCGAFVTYGTAPGSRGGFLAEMRKLLSDSRFSTAVVLLIVDAALTMMMALPAALIFAALFVPLCLSLNMIRQSAVKQQDEKAFLKGFRSLRGTIICYLVLCIFLAVLVPVIVQGLYKLIQDIQVTLNAPVEDGSFSGALLPIVFLPVVIMIALLGCCVTGLLLIPVLVSLMIFLKGLIRAMRGEELDCKGGKLAGIGLIVAGIIYIARLPGGIALIMLGRVVLDAQKIADRHQTYL